MSKDWVRDIHEMHIKYGVHDWTNRKIVDQDKDSLIEYLRFRIAFLHEELNETENATFSKNPEEIVDGLIDLCVVAIGTLDAFAVDSNEAWDRVLKANMEKKVGIKESRPNPLGLPDLIKPDGWEAPNHNGNHGYLPYTFTENSIG